MAFKSERGGDRGAGERGIQLIDGQERREKGALDRRRTRSLMRRTTSLSEISPALRSATDPLAASALSRPSDGRPPAERRSVKRRHSVDLSAMDAAPHCLNACSLCKRSLGPGFDTFMYRGEVAFCSQECREQQMKEDVRKERKKRSLSASIMKKSNLLPPLNCSESSVTSETVAAA